jgi:hypothetical protein
MAKGIEWFSAKHKRAKTVAKFAAQNVLRSKQSITMWKLQTKIVGKRSRSYKNCLVMRAHPVSVIAAELRVALTVFTVSLACAETNCASQQCAVKFRGWLKPVGKLRSQTI